MEDIRHLQESNEALHTCLSRHLWQQQGGFKEPLDIPYSSSKVTTCLACTHDEQLSPFPRAASDVMFCAAVTHP